jgi:hypothetical protein
MTDEELTAYQAEVSRLLAAMVDLEADRDRARDAAVALEQENAQLQDVLKATDRLELSTREDVAKALNALGGDDPAEALDILSDLLESLGGEAK